MWIGTGPLPGIVARVACQTKFFAVAHAKSFTMSATKCQTRRSPGGGRLSGPDFVFADDRDHVVRLEHVREPLARLGGQHLLRILQDAGAADDPARGHVELHVEAAEVVVELGRAEVEAGVPAAQVVVLREARDTTASAGTACRRSAASCGDRGRWDRRAASCATRSRASPSLSPAIGVGQRHQRDGLIEPGHAERPRRAAAATAAAPPPPGAGAAARSTVSPLTAIRVTHHAVGVLGRNRGRRAARGPGRCCDPAAGRSRSAPAGCCCGR